MSGPTDFDEFINLPIPRDTRRSIRPKVLSPLKGQSYQRLIDAQRAEKETINARKRAIAEERGNAELLDRLKTRKNKLGSQIYERGIGADLDKTQICNWKLIDLANGIFQPDFLALNFSHVTTRGQLRSLVRGLWEFSSPTDQCNNTVGRAGSEGNTECWVCGGIIDLTTKIKELQPSCDHVLPIAQAAMFLELFKNPKVMKKFVSKRLIKPSTEIPVLTDAEVDKKVEEFEKKLTHGTPTELMNLEYAWAHLGCNLSKQDMVFIQLNPSDARKNVVTWELNTSNTEKAIRKVLTDSRTENIPARKDGYYILKKGKIQPVDKEEWIPYRVKKMAEFRLNNIVATLNSERLGATEILANESLTKCINTSDPRALQYIKEKGRQVDLVTEAIVGSQAMSVGADTLTDIEAVSVVSSQEEQQPLTKRRRIGQGRKRNRKTRRVRKH